LPLLTKDPTGNSDHSGALNESVTRTNNDSDAGGIAKSVDPSNPAGDRRYSGGHQPNDAWKGQALIPVLAHSAHHSGHGPVDFSERRALYDGAKCVRSIDDAGGKEPPRAATLMSVFMRGPA
jgi:hypothetical protein